MGWKLLSDTFLRRLFHCLVSKLWIFLQCCQISFYWGWTIFHIISQFAVINRLSPYCMIYKHYRWRMFNECLLITDLASATYYCVSKQYKLFCFTSWLFELPFKAGLEPLRNQIYRPTHKKTQGRLSTTAKGC